MIHRSSEANAFEFVRIASLRAAQLMQGCTARVPARQTPILTAQLEVATGMIEAVPRLDEVRRASRPTNDPLEAVPRVRR